MKTLLLICLSVSMFQIAQADGGFPTTMPTSMPTAVPTAMPSIAMPAGSSGAATGLGQKLKVNLNTASKDDLAKLPGIGPTKADAIIAGRPYEKPADVMKVKGIKEGVYNKIKGLITVK